MTALQETTYTVYMHIFPNGKRYIGITGQKPKEHAIERLKEVCNKPCVYIATGVEYPSATIASKETGEPRNTITRHCRKEVQKPRWAFLKS